MIDFRFINGYFEDVSKYTIKLMWSSTISISFKTNLKLIHLQIKLLLTFQTDIYFRHIFKFSVLELWFLCLKPIYFVKYRTNNYLILHIPNNVIFNHILVCDKFTYWLLLNVVYKCHPSILLYRHILCTDILM